MYNIVEGNVALNAWVREVCHHQSIVPEETKGDGVEALR